MSEIRASKDNRTGKKRIQGSPAPSEGQHEGETVALSHGQKYLAKVPVGSHHESSSASPFRMHVTNMKRELKKASREACHVQRRVMTYERTLAAAKLVS